MRCCKCEEKPATFFVSRDGERPDMRVGFCDACADEIGIFSALQKVESVLRGYCPRRSAGMPPAAEDLPVEFAEECHICGMTLDDFERDFRLGCDRCCQIFSSLLYNYVSLLTPWPPGSRLQPLYPGAAPKAPAKRLGRPLIKIFKREIKEDQRREQAPDAPGRPAGRKTSAPPPLQGRPLQDFIKKSRIAADPLEPWQQTRIELRRNLAELVFSPAMKAAHHNALRAFALETAAGRNIGDGAVIEAWRLAPFERMAIEKQFGARRLAPHGLLVRGAAPETLLLADNEDHLHFIFTGAETGMDKALAALRDEIEPFARLAEIAFSPRFGYLTASPRNMGAAARASVLLHLPFSLAQGLTQFLPARADRAGVLFEPYRGRSLERHGFFHVSSPVPFNATEDRIAARVAGFAAQCAADELHARAALKPAEAGRIKNAMRQVIEQSRRSWRLTYQDTLRLTSFLAMGEALGALDFNGFALDRVVPSLSSPFIMYRDRQAHTVNACEKRRADLFADLVDDWSLPANIKKPDRPAHSETRD